MGAQRRGSADLVLMYLPSLVRSLSEVAFSEPARSIKLCRWTSAGSVNETRHTYQHRRLNTPSVPSLQPRPARGLRSKTGGHPPHRRHPSAGVSIVVPLRRTPTSTFSTLDNNTEDAVTPAAPLVPVCARCPPVRVTSLQDLLDAREVSDDFLSERREPDVRTRALDLNGLGGWRGQEIDDGFVVDFDVRTPEKVFASCMLDVGEDVFHRSRDNTGLFIVSRLERGKELAPSHTGMGRTRGQTHQGEGLSGRGLSVGKYNGVVTLHSGDYVVPGDLVVNRFVFGSGDELVEVEFWRSGAGGFRVLGIEFDGPGA